MGIIESDLLDFLPVFAEETEAAIYARFEAWANEGLTVDDADEWIDTRQGSHFFIWSRPIVREVARYYDLLGTEYVAATMAVWSWGQYLDSIVAGFLMERLAATPADGEVTFFGDPGLEILAGAHVGAESATADEQAKEYEVTEGGTIAEPLGPPENLTDETEATGGGLADGDHFYVITTVNDEGESTASAEDKVTLAVGGDGVVKLAWDEVAGATAYRVYHGTAEGGPYDFLAEVTEAAYEDDASPAPDSTIHPPAEDTTGNRITLPVEATESGVLYDASTGEVTVQLSQIGADSITNKAALSGGSDPETDEALLARYLERIEGIGPGNVRAYKVWSGDYPGVGQVTVVANWEGPGTVLIIIRTATGDPVSTDVVEGLQTYLDPVPGKGEGQAPIGHIVTVTTAESVTVDFAAKVEFESGYSLDGAAGTVAMRDPITAAIRAYMESAEPGGEVVRLKAIGRIASFSGVHDIDPASVKLNGAAANITLDDDPAQVAELGEVTLTEGSV